MLFNSLSFIFVFLPLCLLGYLLVGRLRSRSASLSFLVLCSIVFYGAWNPVNLLIITPSIAVNYVLGRMLRQQLAAQQERRADLLLLLGMVFNLCFLGYFKYSNFLLDTSNAVFGTGFVLRELILPLGISFITFQKIAFLVDIRSGTIEDFDLYDFLTFVFFFPQLIAGPIVHYREMMPQFAKLDFRISAQDLAVGACLFGMGLFKKVVLADGISAHVGPAFGAAEQGQHLDFLAGWIGALAYTLQIYFDFAGYSDMAIGLARLFGIRLPVNFNSPLKATSIIEFWSRWHITLTRFLTAYVYTPVLMALTRSRMRRGKPVLTRKKPGWTTFAIMVVQPTLLTMFLSGVWHGAGFTYIVWGVLHGVYLSINHAWRQWRPSWDKQRYDRWMRPIGWLLTFGAVVIGMVLFRAHSLHGAGEMLRAMAGFNGFGLPQAIMNALGPVAQALSAVGVRELISSGATLVSATLWIAGLLAIALALPNSLELLRRFEPALLFTPGKEAERKGLMRMELLFNRRWAAFMAMLFVLAAMGLDRASEFLYWQF